MPANALLELDHATLHVADLGESVRRLEERLGLEARPTSRDPERHCRLFFDRSYIELALSPPPAKLPWTLPWFFLRFADLPARLRAHLDEVRLFSHLQIFDGDDGCWTELRLEAPPGVPPPLLLHRPERPAIGRPFPPPLPGQQLCGAFALAGVCLVTPTLQAAGDFYRRLLGLSELPEPYTDHVFGARRIDLRLSGRGRIALLQPEGQGFGAAWLESRGPGPMGLLLAVESFWQPEQHLQGLGIGSERGLTTLGAELWIDPVETFGVPVGFVEQLAPLPEEPPS